MGEEAALLAGARAGVEEHLVQEDDDGLAFRHALIREAILSDLMTRERRVLHRSVGEAMERLHKDDAEYAGDIAQHLGAAGLADRALPFAMKAGERALRLAAAEPLDQPAMLARIASGLARRAYLYLEDDRGAAWVERALNEARRAGGRGQELFALRLQLQYQHRPGWQAEEEAHIREQLELA